MKYKITEITNNVECFNETVETKEKAEDYYFMLQLNIMQGENDFLEIIENEDNTECEITSSYENKTFITKIKIEKINE